MPLAVLDGMIPRTFCWTTPEERARETTGKNFERRHVKERMLGENKDKLEESKSSKGIDWLGVLKKHIRKPSLLILENLI